MNECEYSMLRIEISEIGILCRLSESCADYRNPVEMRNRNHVEMVMVEFY
jgi:hypothetical protein